MECLNERGTYERRLVCVVHALDDLLELTVHETELEAAQEEAQLGGAEGGGRRGGVAGLIFRHHPHLRVESRI
jgi:hypothetical protein